MKTLYERYEGLVRETEEAFASDFHYLLDIARISRRVASKRGPVVDSEE